MQLPQGLRTEWFSSRKHSVDVGLGGMTLYEVSVEYLHYIRDVK